MKIIISGKAFAKKYKTGVQRYCIELIKALDKQCNGKDIEIVVPNYCEEDFNFKNLKLVKFGKLNLNLWEQIELPRYVRKRKAILINLCNTSPLINPGIVCVHDLNCIKNRQYYPKLFSFWYKIMIDNAIKRANKIITVSNFSKNEIQDFYNIKNVEVVYDSYEHIYDINSDNCVFERIKEIEKDKYFFTLGTVQKNKNIEWILNVAKLNPNKKFVITGYKNQNNIEFDLKNVIYTGYLSDGEIKALMENCRAYIIPSFYEGFGLPPLEAFALGKDVIASDIPIMHELFDDEVEFINPNDYKIDLDKIKSSENRNEVLRKFSWKESAKKLMEIVEMVLI